jgi:hypothetical protein
MPKMMVKVNGNAFILSNVQFKNAFQVAGDTKYDVRPTRKAKHLNFQISPSLNAVYKNIFLNQNMSISKTFPCPK